MSLRCSFPWAAPMAWVAVLLAVALTCCVPAAEPDSGLTASVTDSGPPVDTAPDALQAQDGPLVWPGDGPCVPACPFAKRCEEGLCVNRACTADPQCNPPGGPGPEDQEWFCFHGKCQAYQCGADADCPKGQACNTQTSRCYNLPTGCTHHAACDDGDPCTADTCDQVSGQCKHAQSGNCCKVAADCKASSKCLTATCEAGKCAFSGIDGCCTVAAECYDGEACTTDACSGGKCVFAPLPGCCNGDGACDDGDALSADVCHNKQCVHTWAGLPTQCAGDAACTGNACLSGKCVGGACSYTKTGAQGCCDSHAACATTKGCTFGQCQARVCVSQPVVGVGAHLTHGFDSAALDGWQVVKGNQVSYFHFHSADKVAGAGALRYGVPGKVSIGGGEGNHGSATSPELAVPAQKPALRFEVYFEGNPISSVQVFSIEVLASGKATQVWEKTKNLGGSTQQQWKTQEVSLAAWAGQKVKLRISFDMKFATNKEDKKGLLFDLLEVRGQCP